MTPELNAVLDDLAKVCADAMESGQSLDRDQVDQLVKSLSVNGWQRHTTDKAPLSVQLENRIREQHKEPAIHRGGAIEGLCQEVQQAYEDHARYEASAPSDDESPSNDPRTSPGNPRTNLNS